MFPVSKYFFQSWNDFFFNRKVTVSLVYAESNQNALVAIISNRKKYGKVI